MASKLEWNDERVIDAALDDVTAFLPRAIEEGFGRPFEEVEHGRWRGTTHRAGKRFVIEVAVEARERQTAVSLVVVGDRSLLAKIGIPLLALATASLWIAAASLFVLNWRRAAGGLLPPSLLLFPSALTVLALRLMRAARLDAMAVIGDVERFDRAVDRRAAAPRIASYRLPQRIAPHGATVDDEAELEADAEEAQGAAPRDRA